MRVLILKSDRDAGASLARHVRAAQPAAECRVVASVAEARCLVATGWCDLVIAGLGAADGDVIDFLQCATTRGPTGLRCLVVTRHAEPWPRLALRRLPVAGVIDTGRDGPEAIAGALAALAEDRRPRATEIDGAPAPGAAMADFALLTPTERLVLALAGCGLDPKAITALFRFALRSVETAVLHLHAKLGVHHHGDLAALALRLGLVRFGSAGAIRVGFSLLLADYYAVGQRPCAPTAALLALHPEAAEFAAERERRRAAVRRSAPSLVANSP